MASKRLGDLRQKNLRRQEETSRPVPSDEGRLIINTKHLTVKIFPKRRAISADESSEREVFSTGIGGISDLY